MPDSWRYVDPEIVERAQERLRRFERRQRIWVLHCGDPLPPSDPERRWFGWFALSFALGAVVAAVEPVSALVSRS